MREMKVEVLKEEGPGDRYEQRMKKIVMTPEEQELYAYCPNAAKGNAAPGFPVGDDYGD